MNSNDNRDEKIGIFPSWKWLYATVIVYTVLLIVMLFLLTFSFDFHTQ